MAATPPAAAPPAPDVEAPATPAPALDIHDDSQGKHSDSNTQVIYTNTHTYTLTLTCTLTLVYSHTNTNAHPHINTLCKELVCALGTGNRTCCSQVLLGFLGIFLLSFNILDILLK